MWAGVFEKCLQSKWPSFLERFMKSHKDKEIRSYLVFTFDQLHNSHIAVSRLMTECTIDYLSSDSPRTERIQKEVKTFVQIQT